MPTPTHLLAGKQLNRIELMRCAVVFVVAASAISLDCRAGSRSGDE